MTNGIGRNDDIDTAIRKGYRKLISHNWKRIEQYLEEFEPFGECFVVRIHVDKKEINLEVVGIGYIEEFEEAPNDWRNVYIELTSDTTKQELLNFDIVEESRYWKKKVPKTDTEEFYEYVD